MLTEMVSVPFYYHSLFCACIGCLREDVRLENMPHYVRVVIQPPYFQKHYRWEDG